MKPWKSPRVVTREKCRFDGCDALAEYARGRPINGYCAGHRYHRRRKQPMKPIPRLTLKERLVEFAARINDPDISSEEFERVLHAFSVFVGRQRAK